MSEGTLKSSWKRKLKDKSGTKRIESMQMRVFRKLVENAHYEETMHGIQDSVAPK